jgi:hypothetical protein
MNRMREDGSRVLVVLMLVLAATLVGVCPAGAEGDDQEPVVPRPVRLKHAPQTAQERALPLVVWTERRVEPEPLAIHVLRVDLEAPQVKVGVLLAEDPDGKVLPKEGGKRHPRTAAGRSDGAPQPPLRRTTPSHPRAAGRYCWQNRPIGSRR